jgi:hypothetical protein
VVAETGFGESDVFSKIGGFDPFFCRRKVELSAGDFVADELRALG